MHHDWKELKKSANSCALCCLLRSSIKPQELETLDQQATLAIWTSESCIVQIRETRSIEEGTEIKLWLQGDKIFEAGHLSVEKGTSPLPAPHARTDYEKARQTDFLEEILDHQCDTSPTTDSPVAAKTIQGWINACLDHSVCKTSHVPTPDEEFFRPTRLIAVGAISDPTVRLITNPEVLNNSPGYVALTHCWGDQTKGHVMSKKLSQHEVDSGLQITWKMDELPKNFREAILIVRGIDVPYIRIDSLCIIQDSPGMADWAREAGTMGLIYAHAVCVVSATASSGPEGGCFYPRTSLNQRDEEHLKTPTLPIKKRSIPPPFCILYTHPCTKESLTIHSSTSRETNISTLFSIYVSPSSSCSCSSSDLAPVSSRGWCFQERILAKRIIHYCHGLILFECNTLRASQFDVSGVHYPMKPHLRRDGGLRAQEEFQKLLEVEDLVIPGTKRVNTMAVTGGGMMLFDGGAEEQFTLVPNLQYRSAEQKRVAWLESAALMGMRGEFQLLLMAKTETEQEKSMWHVAWFEIVTAYSKRELTMKYDRLAAITGVASFVERSTGRRSVVGCWEETVAWNLLWSVRGEAKNRVEYLEEGKRPPSWSWVSVDGCVETRMRVLFGTKCVFPDVKWLVESASISRSPKVSEMKVVLKGAKEYRAPASSINFVPDLPDTILDQEDQGYFCLPIVRFSCEASRNQREIHGIVAKRKGKTFNEFERVGYFWAVEERGTRTGVVHPEGRESERCPCTLC